ncbi:MAG: carboxypeptidase-like regulatory domain-containing protein, partial [Janthinobacterium lividum]
MAQVETAQVTGTVTDNSGAVIPNATVVVRNSETGLQRTVTTSGAGLYSAVELPAGPYTLKITAPSFGTF